MGEFFRGWRRKLGVVTLGLALGFTAGWVRSKTYFDRVEFCYSRILKTNNNFMSAYRGIEWISFWGDDPPSSKEKTTWNSGRMNADFSTIRFKSFRRTRNYELGGFVYEDGEFAGFLQMRIIVIPYWSTIIPLTLLSAYLLLVKPRVAKPAKTIEPDRA